MIMFNIGIQLPGMIKTKCPIKKKKSSKTGLDHDKGWQVKNRGATVSLSQRESPFLHSSENHDLFLCTCQGSDTHKRFRIGEREIPLYSFSLNHNSGSNTSTCDKYFFSSGTAEISLSSLALYMLIFTLLLQMTIIKTKNWNMKTKTYSNALRTLEIQGFLTERTSHVIVFKQTAIIMIDVLKHTHQE